MVTPERYFTIDGMQPNEFFVESHQNENAQFGLSFQTLRPKTGYGDAGDVTSVDLGRARSNQVFNRNGNKTTNEDQSSIGYVTVDQKRSAIADRRQEDADGTTWHIRPGKEITPLS